jgi:hypothetical protein
MDAPAHGDLPGDASSSGIIKTSANGHEKRPGFGQGSNQVRGGANP